MKKTLRVPATAKFNYRFIDIARHLAESGHTHADISYVLGVSPTTLTNWKKKYHEFSEAIEKGEQTAKQYLVAQVYRSACGYDYQRETIRYDKKGEVTSRQVNYEHKPADANLAKYWLSNKYPKEWKTIKHEKHDIYIEEVPDVKKVRRLAARILEDDTKRAEGKPQISGEVDGGAEGQGVSEGIPSDVQDRAEDSVPQHPVDVQPTPDAEEA